MWVIMWMFRCVSWIIEKCQRSPTVSNLVTASAEDGVLALNMRDDSVVLIQDALSPVLADPIITHARDHAASMFLYATARNVSPHGGTDRGTDITKWIQRSLASFYVPPSMSITSVDMLRWCADHGAIVDDTMEIVIVDKNFEEYTFRGDDAISQCMRPM